MNQSGLIRRLLVNLRNLRDSFLCRNFPQSDILRDHPQCERLKLMRLRGNIGIPGIFVMTLAITMSAICLCGFLRESGQESRHQVLYASVSPGGLGDGEQDTVKPKAKTISQDFRISEGEEYATLRDDVFFTTSGVVELIPDTAQSTFRVGQKVYAFAALRTPRDERVRFTWYAPDGREVLPSAYFNVEPNLGAVGFRVFSYRTFRKPGDYRVAVFNSAGRMIGESVFSVE